MGIDYRSLSYQLDSKPLEKVAEVIKEIEKLLRDCGKNCVDLSFGSQFWLYIYTVLVVVV